MRRLALVVGLLLTSLAGATDKPPALLEPYAGYDVVFAPHGRRVLGPDAAQVMEKLLAQPVAGCAVGDIGLQPALVTVELRCAVAGAVWTAKVDGTGSFAVAPPSPCTLTDCGGMTLALQERLNSGADTIPWQQVRAQPGAAGDALESLLIEAQNRAGTGDRAAARASLQRALQVRPFEQLGSVELFDVTLLAHEARDDALFEQARKRLAVVAVQLQARGKDGKREAAALKPAMLALAGEATAATEQAEACECEVLPTVRALAAMEQFHLAGKLLDAGPLAAGKSPPRELLKLRFGLASADNDAEAVLTVAKRMAELWPDDPEAVDVLSTGLARADRLREAIELLHDLTLKHPERDIVLGRIAGLINFLTDEAGTNPDRKADLLAVEAAMRKAAANPQDLVARFIVATRDYYAGRLEQALPQLEALANSGNRDPRIPLYLAMAHFWLGHQPKAEEIIGHAVAIGPSDPDVFYCRSQIVRRKDLALAIADLERYEAMTSRPWSVGPKLKADRVAAELRLMRMGRIPPDWDKPGPGRVTFDPAHQMGEPATAATLPADASTKASPAGNAKSERQRPWLPIALLVALAGALTVRWFGRKPK
jgi:tetratricopeptide (TPR) repeat protein